MSKTIYIGGRIESKEKGNVVTGANAILDDTKGKKQNVINKETDDELLRLEQSKQDNLTFDNAPTEDSTNPVTSGGVYTAEKALSDAIEAILLLIPSAATALNKLVDTNTMNSSISMATATFRGTYNVVSDLGLTYQATHAQIEAALDALGLTADNNDYAFVQVPVSDQSQDIAKTERYKNNGTNWQYEYDLNTSGFTAAQWAAINSGITVALVTKLTDLPTAAALQLALNAKQDTLTFDTEPTALSLNPVTSGGIYTAIQAIATALSDYSTTTDGRLGVLEGLIPSEAASNNKLTDKAYVDGLIQAITELIPAEATTSNQLADKAYVLASILAATPAFKGQFTTLAELQAVASPKAGDLGIVRTKDSDGMDVFTVYQYLNNAWNVFYSLSYHPQTKPATTGTTGDYPYNGMGRVELAKNMVNIGTELAPVYENQLTQDMFYKGAVGSRVPNTNTIFVIRYDYVLAENITIPDGCVLEFKDGSISGAYTLTGANTKIDATIYKLFDTNVTINGSWIVPVVYPEWFGAIGDGTTIDDTPFAKMASFINNNTNGHTTIKFGHKHYIFNTGIQIKKDVVINGGGVTLEYTVDTATEIYSGLTIGKDEYLKELNAGTVSGTKDSKVITTSNNVGLVAGDYIVIEDNSDNSYSTERTYWHAGDILKVTSVSGGNINVTEPLTQDYSGASIVLYKLDVVKCHISDINFVCHYNNDITSNGIHVCGAVDSVMENLRGTGSWHLHFGMDHCHNISVSKCFVDCDTPLHGLNYGLVIGSSKNVTIDNCFLKTSRHGLATGGGTVAIPNRYLTITNCVFDGYTDTPCLDQHTNAEYVRVSNCYILNGYDSQASFVTLENSTIINKGLCTFGFGYYSGVKGGLKAFGNTFIMDIAQGDSAKDYVNLQIMQVPEIDDGNSIEIANNKFVLKRLGGSSHYQCHIGFINNGATAHKKVIIKGNTFEGLATLPNVYAYFAYNSAIEDLYIEKNNFVYSLPNFDNVNHLNFSNNILENAYFVSYRTNKIEVIGNTFNGSKNATIDINNPLASKDNSECIISDNTFVNCVKEASTSSSIYNTPFKIYANGSIIIVNNIVITTDNTTYCTYKYRFDETNKAVYQNNKWWSVLTVLNGTSNNATTIIDGDQPDAGSTRPSNVEVGYQFFDTTLGKPIYWNGSSWVDATGATV